MVIPIGQPKRSGVGQTHILHAKAREHHWHGIGTLSIKCFFSGQAFYEVGRGCYLLDEHKYLILNHGQTYSISIDSRQPVESFCLFFAPGFLEEVHRSLTSRTDELTDLPQCAPMPQVSFFEKTYRHDSVLSPLLFALHNAIHLRESDPIWLAGKLHEIADALIRVHAMECRRAQSLSAVRPATREELYRRLHRARDYMLSLYHQPLTLDDLARVACLSPNHFLRMFKQAFRQTPHECLTATRLDVACRMLNRTDLSITDICFAVGFQSPGSFSWLFRQRFGVPPSRYRKR